MIKGEMKAFGAFVKQLAGANLRQATSLALYVRRRSDMVRHVRAEIRKDLGKGNITEERAAELHGFVDVIMGWQKTHGRVEESFDSRDWISLGEGAHMRRKHIDENERPHGAVCGLASMANDTKGYEYEEE